jgi:hypothetical protein
VRHPADPTSGTVTDSPLRREITGTGDGRGRPS